MGEFFTSFDEAWSHFVQRREPLEWFFGDFPEDEESEVQGWLIEPPPDVKERAVEVQNALAQFEWLTLIPDHFLHVWLAGPVTMGNAPDRWPDLVPFAVDLRRLNCFHSAVVVEAHGDGLAALLEGSSLDSSTFLPHMTIAVTREAHDPSALRDTLVPLRDSRCGRAVADEAKLVRFPASQTTLFRPWDVVDTVPFGR